MPGYGGRPDPRQGKIGLPLLTAEGVTQTEAKMTKGAVLGMLCLA